MSSRNFFAELKRRNVYKVAVAYAVVGWVVVQIAFTVLPSFHTPEWVLQTLSVIVALGFPLAVILAWAFDVTPSGIQKTADGVGRTSSRNRQYGWILASVGLVIATIAIGSYWRWHSKTDANARYSAPQRPVSGETSKPIPDKSIAVLPFDNLSRDPDNAFFASGIQDEIITSLAKISGLKVISRTSTAHYQSSPENLPQIAGELRVANVLEGSVQKAGDKVHINVQLIRADTDTHLWAQSYDRGLADIFAVEAEVARNIAESLQTTLSPEEKARVETKPTENADAYVLYLRAREYQTRPTALLEDFQTAEQLYTRALQLDPGFALAHARLSATLAQVYQSFQPLAEIKTRARGEAEESLRLRPNLGEGHLARALCFYRTELDYDAALRELEIAGRLLPHDPDVESTIAYIRRRQGRYNDAAADLQRVLERDPQNASLAEDLFTTRSAVRDWPGATAAGSRAVAIAPDSPTLAIEVSYVGLWSKGDLTPLRTTLDAIPAGVDPDGGVTVGRWDAALLAGDFDAAERVVAGCAREAVLTGEGISLPKTYLLGCIALARGDAAHAQPLFEAARPAMERESLASPLDAPRHAQLGLLYAYLGRKEDALREGRRAVELLPESKDARDGPSMAGYFALICARTGESEQALSLIEHLLKIPGGGAIYIEANMTLQELRLRWQWDPLRKDPRFQKIIAEPEPKTVYR